MMEFFHDKVFATFHEQSDLGSGTFSVCGGRCTGWVRGMTNEPFDFVVGALDGNAFV
jgi:hypothetical protein